MFDNDEVERVALDLWKQFNPAHASGDFDEFGGFGPYPVRVEHIDDVMDGGRYRKLAKHVLANYGKAV